jgi:hypothetical protein
VEIDTNDDEETGAELAPGTFTHTGPSLPDGGVPGFFGLADASVWYRNKSEERCLKETASGSMEFGAKPRHAYITLLTRQEPTYKCTHKGTYERSLRICFCDNTWKVRMTKIFREAYGAPRHVKEQLEGKQRKTSPPQSG